MRNNMYRSDDETTVNVFVAAATDEALVAGGEARE